MHVNVRLDGRRPRRWHAELVGRLARQPGIAAVSVDDAPGPDLWPANAEILFRLEALLHRLSRAGSQPVSRSDIPARSGTAAEAECVVDLCGDVVASVPVWRPTFGGRPGEPGLLASLLGGEVPAIALARDGTVVAVGRLGTDQPGLILAGFDDALARTVTVIAAALRDRREERIAFSPVAVPVVPPAVLPLTALGCRAGKLLSSAVAMHLYRLCYRAPHWCTGWRRVSGSDLIDLGGHPASGWSVLPDDGHRFYADPFPLAFAGSTHVFVEDFPHATAKGLISAVRIGPDGPVGTPVPVLEEPYHLSYPFVFVRDGEAWMVPESSSGGTVDLYRATRYPGGWVKEATLLSGLVASDATLVEHSGRWWLLACVRDAPVGAPLGAGSYSDALHIWSAPDFRGPYTPIAGNPVLVDPATARPAGRIVKRGGHLIRPVQDCAGGYGRALSLARIDRLDQDGFAQTVVRRIENGPRWPGNRIHTLNADGGIECIDGSARAPRIRMRRAGRAPISNRAHWRSLVGGVT